MRQSLKKGDLIILALFLVIAFLLRIWKLGEESIWIDELFTYRVIQSHTPHEFLQTLKTQEANPPLYFLLLKGWRKFWGDIFGLRLFSVILGTISIAVVFFFYRKIMPRIYAILATALFTFSPFHIWYSQEMRSYSLLVFFVLLSSYSLWEWLENNKRGWKVLYFLSSTGGLWTHYHFLFVLFSQSIFVFFITKNRRKEFIYLQFLILLTLLPLFPLILWHLVVTKNPWLPTPDELTPFRIISALSFGWGTKIPTLPKWISLCIVFTGLLNTGKQVINQRKKDGLSLCFCIFISIFTVTLLVSLFTPVLLEGKRYSIILLPFFFPLVINGLPLNQKKKGWIIIGLFLPLFFTLKNYYHYPRKRPWKEICQLISKNCIPGKDVVIIEGISPEIFQIYKVPPLKILEISRIDSLKKLRDKYKRLWYITIYPQDTPFERELFGKFHCLGIRIAPSSTGLIKLFLFKFPLS